MAIFYDYKILTGMQNMQEDSNLLDFAIQNSLNEPIFRLYGWSPACVSLGRNQSDENVNVEYCKQNNIDIVKRLTGGRALLHDKEVTYAIILPASFLNNGETVINSYKEISNILINAFKYLGIEVEFPQNKKVSSKFDYCMSISTGADLSYEGKKVVGSAQYRKQGYILQHGSILIDFDEEKIETIFNEKIAPDSITTLKTINPNISIEMLTEALQRGYDDFVKSYSSSN